MCLLTFSCLSPFGHWLNPLLIICFALTPLIDITKYLQMFLKRLGLLISWRCLFFMFHKTSSKTTQRFITWLLILSPKEDTWLLILSSKEDLPHQKSPNCILTWRTSSSMYCHFQIVQIKGCVGGQPKFEHCAQWKTKTSGKMDQPCFLRYLSL